ncbi:MAG: UDP-N-acetylmuramate--L-alanine ligase, partial [Candidatus Gastranaerophilales bacterium]|nr:UDP-N-acetylmuramate--L-alanine ligase [Candidatus Gastranaerophilales bacterium]
ENLMSKQAKITIGHNPKNVESASLVVASSAIKQDNPEIIRAKELNIPIIHRSQLLEAMMSGLGREDKPISIGVSGTHGKTTTTGMMGMIFEHSGLKPSIVVGGMIPALNTNSKFDSGKYFVSELDESDGTIKEYRPDYTIITNLEKDHVDHYADGLQQVLDTFRNYITNLPEHSKIVVNVDDKGINLLLKSIDFAISCDNIITYSLDENANAHYLAKNIIANGFNTSADIYKDKNYIGTLCLTVPGIHNISNALATIAVALDCGVSFDEIKKSLGKFTGMKRRFQLAAEVKGVRLVDDYAHHPTEIEATLKSAKELKDKRIVKRIVAIFQPHRYTRLHGLWDDFKTCFANADKVYAVDVYPAGESPIKGYGTKEFCEQTGYKYLAGDLNEVAVKLDGALKEGDLVLALGAGSIVKLSQMLKDRI